MLQPSVASGVRGPFDCRWNDPGNQRPPVPPGPIRGATPSLGARGLPRSAWAR